VFCYLSIQINTWSSSALVFKASLHYYISGGNTMFIPQASHCHECKNEIGEQRPTLLVRTQRGTITLCPTCAEKFNKVVRRDETGTALIRECDSCRTIIAADYESCFINEEPDIDFWLCAACYEEAEKMIQEEQQ